MCVCFTHIGHPVAVVAARTQKGNGTFVKWCYCSQPNSYTEWNMETMIHLICMQCNRKAHTRSTDTPMNNQKLLCAHIKFDSKIIINICILWWMNLSFVVFAMRVISRISDGGETAKKLILISIFARSRRYCTLHYRYLSNSGERTLPGTQQTHSSLISTIFCSVFQHSISSKLPNSISATLHTENKYNSPKQSSSWSPVTMSIEHT